MKKQLILYFIIIYALTVKSQHFQTMSQYYMNGQFINPAYAGSREVLSANFMVHQQWIGLKGAPKTVNFGFHSPLKKINLALGLVVFNDNIGVSNFTGIGINYVYRIRMKQGKRNLAFGLKTGLTSFKADLSNLKLNEQGDKLFEGVTYHQTKFDPGFGIYYYAPHFYFSYSLPLLFNFGYNSLNAVDTITNKAITSYLSSGFIFNIGNDIQFHPSFMFKSLKNINQLDIKMSVIAMNTLSIGISIRKLDAIGILLEYQINEQIRVGYAHDFVTSTLQNVTRGTNEFVVRYELIKHYNLHSTKFF